MRDAGRRFAAVRRVARDRQALVADPRIKAVGFTGSRRGGVALMHIAAARPEPIPRLCGNGSINPVLLFPAALDARHDAIAPQFVASLTLGAGQFCTNPGLVLAVDGPALRAFEETAAAAVRAAPAQTMLTPPIHASYEQGVAALRDHAAVELLAQGIEGNRLQARAALLATSADAFIAHPELRDEVFGPASLIVRCPDADTLHRVLKSLEGQLTIAAHLADGDAPLFAALRPLLERKAGRILVNGFGTGVEVGHAMVHGGPFPATSDTRTTSVGARAIERFLRPVSYQDLPDALLPDAIRNGNPLNVPQRIDRRAAPRRREMSASTDEIVLSLDEVHALAARADAQRHVRRACACHRQRDHAGPARRMPFAWRVPAARLRAFAEEGQGRSASRADAAPVVVVDRLGRRTSRLSLLSFETGLPVLVEMAKQHGIAAMTINHCYHFSALARGRGHRRRGAGRHRDEPEP